MAAPGRQCGRKGDTSQLQTKKLNGPLQVTNLTRFDNICLLLLGIHTSASHWKAGEVTFIWYTFVK